MAIKTQTKMGNQILRDTAYAYSVIITGYYINIQRNIHEIAKANSREIKAHIGPGDCLCVWNQ